MYIASAIVVLRLVLAHLWACGVVCIVICNKKTKDLLMSPPSLIITTQAVGCLLSPLNVVTIIKGTFGCVMHPEASILFG